MEFQLNDGYVAIIDGEDYERLAKHHWWYNGNYAIRQTWPDRKTIMMHREIMNTPDGYVTDHINHNGLDNRKSNLRVCTQSQNMMNMKRPKRNTSGHKGISRWQGKWRVQLSIDKRNKHIGMYDNETEAIEAYNRAAKKYHGEFANGS